MKNKLIVIIIVVLTFLSCDTYKNLPSYKEIGTGTHGGFISVVSMKNKKMRGELIAVDNLKLVILTNEKKVKLIRKIDIKDIRKFYLYFAKRPSYQWAPVILPLMTLSHGFYLVFTAPLNLIVTMIVNAGANSAYTYNQNNLKYEELYKFARFPQGIPKGISLDSIR